MGRVRKKQNPDRYLVSRSGNYSYKRRVPTHLIELDGRGEHVRVSLKTDDLAQARLMRDAYESADDNLWASFSTGAAEDVARKSYQAAVKRAQSLGFTYRPTHEILRETTDTIIQRLDAALNSVKAKPVVEAAIGLSPRPVVTVKKAFKLYLSEISPHEIAGKSAGQKQRWEDQKQLSINNFIEVVGNLAMDAISRDDARKFYDFWMKRIAPKTGVPTHSSSSGNKNLGNLRGFTATISATSASVIGKIPLTG